MSATPGEPHDSVDCEVAVVVVSWNTRALLERAIRSIPAVCGNRAVAIHVVDNASVDGSADMVAECFPGVVLWRLTENVGFGQANNLAIATSSGPYVLLLNSDAELWPGALDALVTVLASAPEAGAVGAKLIYPDGRGQPSAFAFPTLWRYALELLGIGDAATTGARRGGEDVDWVSGACLLLRRQALDMVGAFDPGFHMYAEEMDLCKRLWRCGWTVRQCPAAVAVHHVGQSVQRRCVEQPRLLWVSRLRYHRKHYPAWESVLLAGMVRAAFLARWLAWSVRGLMAPAESRGSWRTRALAARALALNGLS